MIHNFYISVQGELVERIDSLRLRDCSTLDSLINPQKTRNELISDLLLEAVLMREEKQQIKMFRKTKAEFEKRQLTIESKIERSKI